MPKIKVSDVIVADGRQRTEVKELNALKDSIRVFGLIQPIILDEDNRLIAGYRRLMAHQELEIETIEFVRKKDLSDINREIIELEENIQREDLGWWDRVNATTKIHHMLMKYYDDWNADKTAALLGYAHRTTVHKAIELTNLGHEDRSIVEATTLRSAMNRARAKKIVAEKEAILNARAAGLTSGLDARIVCGDAIDLIKTLPGESIDTVITNPPFGVDLHFDGYRPYEDTEEHVLDLYRKVFVECYRVMAKDSWLVTFFSILNLHEVIAILREAGFYVQSEMPSIWVKPNKTQGNLGDVNRNLIVAYEVFLWARKGEPVLLKQGRQNIFIYDQPLAYGDERITMVQQSYELSEELVSMTSLGGSMILDPFAGSGSVGIGALNNQCHFIGFELDKETARRGNINLQSHVYANETESNDD